MRWVIRGFVVTCLALGPLMAGAALGQSARPNGIPPHWLEGEGHPARTEWRDPRTGAVCEFGGTLTDTGGPEDDRRRMVEAMDNMLRQKPGLTDYGALMITVSPVTIGGQRGVLSERTYAESRNASNSRQIRERELSWIIRKPGDRYNREYWDITVFGCRSPEAAWAQTLPIFEKVAARFLSQGGAAPTPAAPVGPVGSAGPTGLGQIPGRWPVTSVRVLDPSEVVNLSAGDLRLMRNEIFARHGHVFQSADLRAYFGQQSWYSPQAGDATGRLSAIERRNVETIQAAERGARR